jgi:thiamine biosynthesis lipoprotein
LISPLLVDLVAASFEVAELTGGLVDPTVGGAVIALGYDDDFARIPATGPALAGPPLPAPGWRL